jgi:aminodeoxyfutalosine deaminase
MAEPRDLSWTLTARWVFPVAGPPLRRARITVTGQRIEAVQRHRFWRKADVDLGNVAVLPGFANAHTHLDLSGADCLVPARHDFIAWLRRVIVYRRGRTTEETLRDIQAGIEQSVCSGTTLLGDISGNGASWRLLANAPLRGIVYRELLGLTEIRAAQAYECIGAWLAAHAASATCRPGLSPHAPYSTRLSIHFMAGVAGVPTAVHLAETDAELVLLAFHSGPLHTFLKELEVWDPDGLADSVSDVLRVMNGRSPVLFVHGNYLQPDAPVPANGSIVYCPRTHAAFGHPAHPFRGFLSRGVRVALGTDSLASNPDLSILNEARFVHARYPDFSMPQLLRMATLSGAEALGWADECGSLEPGKSADLAVVALPEQEECDPHQLLFESTLPVERVMFRGQWIFPPGANATGLANSP